MNVDWGDVFRSGLALLGGLAVYYSTRVGAKGKRRDQEQLAIQQQHQQRQEERKQDLAELEASLASARADLQYHEDQARLARERQRHAEEARDRSEAEAERRLREVARRCRDITLQVGRVLASTEMPPDQRERLTRALRDMENHLREDHGL